MIGKIIAGSSFGATVDYVMNRCRPEDGEGHRAESIIGEAGMDKTERGKVQSRILGFEGIEPPGIQDMVRDFKDQTLLNPRIKNAVGHISLSFSKNGLEFSGSKIDRAFSFSKLDRYFTQQQHRTMLVDNLGKVAGRYRSAFAGLFGSMGGKARNNIGSVDLGGGIGVIPLPPRDSSVGLSAAQMQRRQGESPEEHIARITALLREVEEAMLIAAEERRRKLRQRKVKDHSMGL